jgi:hypothetical protein
MAAANDNGPDEVYIFFSFIHSLFFTNEIFIIRFTKPPAADDKDNEGQWWQQMTMVQTMQMASSGL